MGVQLTYGTVGATGGGFSALKCLQPAFAEGQLNVRPDWSWQRRSAKTWKDRNAWVSCWPRGQFSMAANDGSYAGVPVGLDYSGAMGYEPFSCDGEGTQTLKFLKGLVVDASDNPIPSATVQAFRTSDDAFAGYEASCRADGSYDLATNFPGVNHYVVGYDPGSPDRGGTTLNTLVPTNIDGS